jgi:hypothetical protein
VTGYAAVLRPDLPRCLFANPRRALWQIYRLIQIKLACRAMSLWQRTVTRTAPSAIYYRPVPQPDHSKLEKSDQHKWHL